MKRTSNEEVSENRKTTQLLDFFFILLRKFE